MIKRPLNARFREKVPLGIKVTTIRDKAWPLRVPIMLYSWSGKAYASKHDDLCAVRAVFSCPIMITHDEGGRMFYEPEATLVFARPLWSLEGFESQDDMDHWFRSKMKRGQCVEKALMVLEVIGGEA